MKSKWTMKDDKLSLKQGWGIFQTDRTDRLMLEILKYDESDRFQSDDEAVDHVLRNAKKGGLCRRAVKQVYGF